MQGVSSHQLEPEKSTVGQHLERTWSNEWRAPRRTALVIDLDTSARATVASALERLGFTVLEATNGYSGLRMVHHHQPHVVVMEPLLPEMSGEVMVREMRRDPQTRDIPIVLISGNAGSTREEVGHLVDAVISKPCEPNELEQTVERLSAVPAGA